MSKAKTIRIILFRIYYDIIQDFFRNIFLPIYLQTLHCGL